MVGALQPQRYNALSSSWLDFARLVGRTCVRVWWDAGHGLGLVSGVGGGECFVLGWCGGEMGGRCLYDM